MAPSGGRGKSAVSPPSVDKQTSGERTATAAFVKGFGCRPHDGRHRVFGGRRPKASKGGNRD
jgi:hypothetical protein